MPITLETTDKIVDNLNKADELVLLAREMLNECELPKLVGECSAVSIILTELVRHLVYLSMELP